MATLGLWMAEACHCRTIANVGALMTDRDGCAKALGRRASDGVCSGLSGLGRWIPMAVGLFRPVSYLRRLFRGRHLAVLTDPDLELGLRAGIQRLAHRRMGLLQ